MSIKSLRKTILEKNGTSIPDASILFLKQGGVLNQQQYNQLITKKIQENKTRKGCSQFMTAFLSKCKHDLKDAPSPYPSAKFMNNVFMFGLSTNRYDNPTLNFWGDFRKNERVSVRTPIRYRGYFEMNKHGNRLAIHVFEWKQDEHTNVVSVYSEIIRPYHVGLTNLVRNLFDMCHLTSEQQQQVLSFAFEEAFFITTI